MRPIREDQRQCPVCEGRGTVGEPPNAQVCPKCKGERIISNPIRLG